MSNKSKQFEPSKRDIIWCGDRVEQDKQGKTFFVSHNRRNFHLVRIALSSILGMSGHRVTTFAEIVDTTPEGEKINSYGFATDLPYSEYVEKQMEFESTP